MIEREKKRLLTPEEYAFLMQRLPSAAVTTTQVNYYYDTPDGALNALDITYRIRECGGGCLATVKIHESEGEESRELSFSTTEQPDTVDFGRMRLLCQGTLTTARTTFSPGASLCVCLDRNDYLGVTDYELEVEYAEEAAPLARRYLENLAAVLAARGLIPTPDVFLRRGQAPNKARRFFVQKQEG